MTITPDDKDWTWVLDEACTECGLDTRAIAPTDVGAMVRDMLGPWRTALLSAPADVVSRRPAQDTWSALEYGCHVRDVFLRFDMRLHLMLSETDPQFPNWDQDATAVDDDYDGQDPVVVAGELEEAGVRIADSFDAVRGEEWNRTGARSDGARFTVATFARYFIHDPIHHLYDVTGQRH